MSLLPFSNEVFQTKERQVRVRRYPKRLARLQLEKIMTGVQERSNFFVVLE